MRPGSGDEVLWCKCTPSPKICKNIIKINSSILQLSLKWHEKRDQAEIAKFIEKFCPDISEIFNEEDGLIWQVEKVPFVHTTLANSLHFFECILKNAEKGLNNEPWTSIKDTSRVIGKILYGDACNLWPLKRKGLYFFFSGKPQIYTTDWQKIINLLSFNRANLYSVSQSFQITKKRRHQNVKFAGKR